MSLALAVVVLLSRVPEIRGADAVDEPDGAGKEHTDATAWRAMLRVATPVTVSLLTLAVALGLSGLGRVRVTIAAFLALVGVPEITAVRAWPRTRPYPCRHVSCGSRRSSGGHG